MRCVCQVPRCLKSHGVFGSVCARHKIYSPAAKKIFTALIQKQKLFKFVQMHKQEQKHTHVQKKSINKHDLRVRHSPQNPRHDHGSRFRLVLQLPGQTARARPGLGTPFFQRRHRKQARVLVLELARGWHDLPQQIRHGT